jgi:dienelactone hydrolase
MHSKEERRTLLYSLLGDLPEKSRPVNCEILSIEDRGTYILETLLLDLNGIERVPAYFARPKAEGKRYPAILFNHSHGGHYELGKEEFITGREYLARPSYAEAITSWGFAGLCIDAWAFGERRGLSESETFKLMLWKGQVMWGMMVYDSLKAIDYLTGRPDIDPLRIGTVGISMGSTMAWWLAALDTRVSVCVDICCLTDFHSLIESRGLDEHGIYYYVPGLLKFFTTAQINALIAPRPHLALAGNSDRLTPPAGLDRLDEELSRAYAEEGSPDAFRLIRSDTGHFETAMMRKAIGDFFRAWL